MTSFNNFTSLLMTINWSLSLSSHHAITKTSSCAVVPAAGPPLWWWPAGRQYRGVSSLCCGEHWGCSRAPARGRAAGGRRQPLPSASRTWRTRSRGSVRWSSSWAWTPRVDPRSWTGGSAGPRRFPAGSRWWRPRRRLLGGDQSTLSPEQTGERSDLSRDLISSSCYFVGLNLH